jgi:hypothetical protein
MLGPKASPAMMRAYASRTGTRSTLAAMKNCGWRVLVVAGSALRPEGLPYALDNGAWSCFLRGTEFNPAAFNKALEAVGSEADWIVLPDIVSGGFKSLDLSLNWLDRVAHFGLPLLPVQDGIGPADVRQLIGPGLGIFLGGTTSYKLSSMRQWGQLAADVGAYFHVARVNSKKRINLCQDAGAHSFDGTSVSRFGKTLRQLDLARRQQSLFGNLR